MKNIQNVLQNNGIPLQLLECPKSEALKAPNTGSDMEQVSFIVDGSTKWYSQFGK